MNRCFLASKPFNCTEFLWPQSCYSWSFFLAVGAKEPHFFSQFTLWPLNIKEYKKDWYTRYTLDLDGRSLNMGDPRKCYWWRGDPTFFLRSSLSEFQVVTFFVIWAWFANSKLQDVVYGNGVAPRSQSGSYFEAGSRQVHPPRLPQLGWLDRCV